LRVLARDCFEAPLRFIKLAAAESCLGQSQLKLGQEVVLRQKAAEAKTFRAIRFRKNQCRRPLGLEPAKVLWPLFDVNFDGDEALADKLYDFFIRINLGIQPSASASHRRGAEIEEDHFIAGPCSLESLVRVT